MWFLVTLALCVGLAKGREAPLVAATFASDPEQAFFLLKAFKHHGHSRYHVLGSGQAFQGSVHKLHMLKEFVHSSSVKATDFLLVCDGYFTFVTSGQSDFIRNFMTFRADVVFAAKAGSEGEPEAPLAKSRFRFLSSGALMARVHILKEILDMDFSSFATDADFYKSVFATKRFNMKLDTEKVLFCALVDHEDDKDDIELADRRFVVKETSSVPLLLFGSQSEGMHAFYRILRRKIQPRIHISQIEVFPKSGVINRGETMWITFNCANANEFDLEDQFPDPTHVYNSSSNFIEDGFNGQFARFRMGIDYEGRNGIDHPWRWGYGEKISSGNQKTLVLGVTMNECLDNRLFKLGYVFENFFWVVDIFEWRMTVKCP